ncbi:hypothetical protein ABS768_14040 [Flavobacterium sp. ST-75]|uniref:DUF1735 domain-containing protein n=1 Tax=Flavobacterium rhizophilum TaxID=3163296 RepID=A0ABW8YGL7_9FLAO
MKKFIYGLLGFAAISLTSCDYHDPNSDKFGNDSSSGWVQFESEGVTYASVIQGTESTVTASIPLVIKSVDIVDLNGKVTPNNPVNEGLTVNYTIEDIDGSSSYINIPGSVYIPKGELSANISFTVPASAQVACSHFKVTLTSTSKSNVTVGFEDSDFPTQEFVVSALDINDLVGTYSAVRDGATQYTSSIELGAEENQFIINNIYGANGTTTVYLNNDGTFTYPSPEENFLFNDNGGVGNVFLDGINGFATCLNGGTVNVNYRLVFSGGSTNTINVVFTKQ